jgi:Mg2+ and Co2+ transporter CorA
MNVLLLLIPCQQYQVNRDPRRRLLQHIHQLKEELAAVRQAIETSLSVIQDYASTLAPNSYRNAPARREKDFANEESFLQMTIVTGDRQLQTLANLERRIKGLAEQVKRSVDVLEEDNGKAILIFTVVTTIFLPLSFMTGLFGMNTSDIRNLQAGQGLFWSVALPFTTIIAATVILIAFRGDDVLEYAGSLAQFLVRHFWRPLAIVTRRDWAPAIFGRRSGVKRAGTGLTFDSLV